MDMKVYIPWASDIGKLKLGNEARTAANAFPSKTLLVELPGAIVMMPELLIVFLLNITTQPRSRFRA